MAVLNIIILQNILIIASFYLFSKLLERRIKRVNSQLETVARSVGFKKMPFAADSIMHQLKGFKLFRRERNRLVNNGVMVEVYHKEMDDFTNIYLFEYSYTKKKGKTTESVHHLVFFADNKNWYLPNFELEPETWWHKLKAKMFGSDINFENNEKFSDRYWLTSEFEDMTRKVFRPEVKAFLNSRPPIKLEGANYYLLASIDSDPETVGIKRFYQDCMKIVELLKNGNEEMVLELSNLQPTKELVESLLEEAP